MRHWNDAELLEKERRRANANQLYGFAAECAIKSALCQLPGFAPEGELSPHYKAHINDLWKKVHVQGLQKRFPNLMMLMKQESPFDDWSVDHRYAREGTVSEDAYERHRKWAKRLLGAVGISGSRAGG